MATKIEWTEETWNPIIGCTPISEGCRYCYARRLAQRLREMGVPGYEGSFDEVKLMFHRLEQPLRWGSKRRMIFCCSMSDLFHDQVPDSYIERIFQVIRQTPQHIYQLLTKRYERLQEWGDRLGTGWPINAWAGVTVENERWLKRADALAHVDARVRFISFEPLLGPIPYDALVDSFRDNGISWVIVGGESGPKHRPMDEDWVRTIRDAAKALDIAFFYKQKVLGSQKVSMPLLDGQKWDEYPRAGIGQEELFRRRS